MGARFTKARDKLNNPYKPTEVRHHGHELGVSETVTCHGSNKTEKAKETNVFKQKT